MASSSVALQPATTSAEDSDTLQPLTTALTNIRRLSSSSLAHQAKPAQVLIAIESTLSAELPAGSEHTPTAYFAASLSCLSKAVPASSNPKTDIAETGGLTPAILYLLATVLPYTPRPILLSHLPTLLPLLTNLFPVAQAYAPPLRSLLQITATILTSAPPASTLSSPLLKKLWNHVLLLLLDARPKIRHLAHESVRRTLMMPTPPRITPGGHPYTTRSIEWALSVLQEEVAGGAGKKVKFAAGTGGDDVEGKKAIWVVQALRGWVGVWDKEVSVHVPTVTLKREINLTHLFNTQSLSQLCPLLLSLPPHPHLTAQVYSLLAHLLSPASVLSVSDADGPTNLPNLPTILTSLLASPPHPSQSADAIEYSSAVSAALIKLARQDPASVEREYFNRAWTVMWTNVLTAPASAASARQKASEALGGQGLVRYCISDRMVELALEYKRIGGDLDSKRQKMKPPLLIKLINQLEGAINTLPLMLPYLLPILTALISRLRRAPSGEAPTHGQSKAASPATTMLLGLVTAIADFRVQPGFEHKDKVDDVVGMAIEVMGAKVVLDALPLNVEPDA